METERYEATRYLLTLANVSLDYGQFRALHEVDFAIDYARIHAVVGEHGAGKSSLAMLIAGLLKPQAGSIWVEGREYHGFSLKLAQQLGIYMVHQHQLSLNEHFSVAENLFLTAGPYIETLKWKYETLQAAQALLAQHQIDLNPELPVAKLNLSDRILIDILKHLQARPKLLILDEALEKLASASLKKVIAILMSLKASGASILLITHRIDEVFDLADRVSVVKNGEILITDHVRNIDRINLIKMAYMQLSAEQQVEDLNKEFYHLLKYNEAILRHLPVNLIVTDDARRIKMVNDYCKQTFDLQKTSYFNVPLDELLASNHADVLNLLHRDEAHRTELILYQVPVALNNISVTCKPENVSDL